MFQRPFLIPALSLVIATAACGDRPSPVAAGDPGLPRAVAVRALPPGLDGRFMELARQVPSFGGYFFDENGDLVVNVTDLGQAAAVRSAVSDVALARPSSPRHPYMHPADILVRQADYNFPQLSAWRDRMLDVAAIEGVQMVDVNEATNRVEVGVSSDAAAARVRALAQRAGVPARALVVQRMAPPKLLSTLSDNIRPTEGGIRLDNSGCTLGLNAWYSNPGQNVPVGTAGFFTASHCSTTSGVTDGAVEAQGGATIGHELYDPAFFTQAQNSSCPAGKQCRFSDVSFYAYYGGVSWQLGAVARTLTRGIGLFNSGSTTIDASYPRFTLVATTSSPVMGTYLEKVGVSTGWTEGAVSNTCAGVAQGSIPGHWLLCQDQLDAYAWGGDSGSPVFQWIVTGSNAYVAGIVWGATVNPSNGASLGGLWFSTTQGVSNDFGNVTWF